MANYLTREQQSVYYRDGFIVVEDLLPPDQVEALGRRVREYTHAGRPAGSIRMQMEPRVQRGELQVDEPGDGYRKIDGLVENDDLFQDLGLNRRIVGIMAQLLGPDLKMFRNALLLKAPSVGSQKGMHQDSPYWPIAPMDLCSCWFALDDATPDNGCMGVLAGGQHRGPLPHVRVTDDFVVEEGQYEMGQMVLAPVRAGGGLFFHSLLPHYTAPNRTQSWRRAIALSYMSSRSHYTGEGEGPEYFHVRGERFAGCVR
ncbi:MAG: phytanoyl-CoA dioxygenase family protein [Candidatus Latescibacteria bacterium]|nr:phytanoyl-CoA dioxygenase family protein [Candidatus Latescibacterota bacterium]